MPLQYSDLFVYSNNDAGMSKPLPTSASPSFAAVRLLSDAFGDAFGEFVWISKVTW